MSKVYIATRNIYDEYGEVVYEAGDVLDRGYDSELCIKTNVSELAELVLAVDIFFCEQFENLTKHKELDDSMLDIKAIMYDIISRE